jgi:hypothetical protein
MEQLNAWKLSRAAGASINLQALSTRARQFTSTLDQTGPVSLIVTRDREAITDWFVAPASQQASNAAINLATSLAARADQADGLPDLDAPYVGWLVAKPGAATRDTQAGTDPAEVSRGLARMMQAGSWVGISIRQPKRAEIRRSHRWYKHRLGTALPTHHAFSDGTVVISVFAGGHSKDEVKSMLSQVSAMLPGFDVTTGVKIAAPAKAVVLPAVLGLTAFGGTAYLTKGDLLLANAAGAVPAGYAVGISTGVIPTQSSKTLSTLATGRLPKSLSRRFPPKKPKSPKAAQIAGTRAAEGDPGSYPLATSSFLVGPTVPIGLVAPHAGAATGSNVNEIRAIPKELVTRIGPVIGFGGPDDTPVHISARDLFAGISAFGAPGSGKSWFIHALWAWMVLDRIEPSGIPGAPGSHNALIAFEGKEWSGAEAYKAWSEGFGDRVVVVDALDPNTYAIDLFAGVEGSAAKKARWMLSALKYTFDEGEIKGRSSETFEMVLPAALSVTPEIATEAGVPTNLSPFGYASILLGSKGDAEAVRLATALAVAADKAEAEAKKAHQRELTDGSKVDADKAFTELGEVVKELNPIFGFGNAKPVSESVRRTQTEAARNKIKALMALEPFWSPDRKKITWKQVLDNHGAVIINTSNSSSGEIMDTESVKALSSLLMFGLKTAIEQTCPGWQNQGRSVSIFSDELTYLAGNSSEVLSWLRNQGRSFGVKPFFATQYPEQLPDALRVTVMGFGTLLAFSQNNHRVIADIVADLALNGEEWSSADIAGMERYTAAIRTTVDGQRPPTTMLRLASFEDGLRERGPEATRAALARFRKAQGWGPDGRLSP